MRVALKCIVAEDDDFLGANRFGGVGATGFGWMWLQLRLHRNRMVADGGGDVCSRLAGQHDGGRCRADACWPMHVLDE